MADVIPDELTPQQLRDEATRRELRDRHRTITARRTARNEVVDAIMAIDKDAVRLCGAAGALRAALTWLAREDASDQEKAPTNGDVHLAGKVGWWDAVRKEIPYVEAHPVIDGLTRGNRKPVW